MMMVEEKDSYLDITEISSAQVEDGDECGFACAANPKCFSYNLEAVTGTLLCKLLPSDKYNNSGNFTEKRGFHHYSIWVSNLVQYYLKFCVLRRKAPKENTFLIKSNKCFRKVPYCEIIHA